MDRNLNMITVAPNGIKMYILALDNLEDNNFIALSVNAGSAAELKGEEGIAHFLEHIQMSFFDTKNAGFGSFAHTDFYSTSYYFDVKNSDFHKVKKIIQNIINGSFISKANLQDIRQDILVEYDHYQNRINNLDFTFLLNGSEYEKHLPIGRKKCIESFSLQQVQNFYNLFYSMKNMGLIWITDPKTLSLFGTAWIENLVGNNENCFINNLNYNFKSGEHYFINKGSKVKTDFFFYHKRKKGEVSIDATILMCMETVLRYCYPGSKIVKMHLSNKEEFVKVTVNEITDWKKINNKISYIDKKNIKNEYLKLLSATPNGYNCNSLREQLINSYIFCDEIYMNENESFDTCIMSILEVFETIPYVIMHKSSN